MKYIFGDVSLDTERYLLRRSGEPVPVQPQVFEVLRHLIENRDRVLLKTELLDEIWGDQFVGESALTSRIKSARQAVGDDGVAQNVIRTVHGRGYQFVGDVATAEPQRPPAPLPSLEQRIQFCETDDNVRLAYATVGEGPPLVRAAHWVTHLDYDWQSPVWRHWLEGLANGRTLIRYDERGCGLSESEPGEISFDAWVKDLETVVDALELDRFDLIGPSQGGAVAAEYVRRHPERVNKLIIYGANIEGRHVAAKTDADRRHADLQREMVTLGWGHDDPAFRRYFTSTFIPDAPSELWDMFAELLRRTSSSESAAQIMEVGNWIDARDAAAAIEVPTLIVHPRDDQRVPFDESLKWASLIKNSRLVPLDTPNHLMRADEPAWEVFMQAIDSFLAEEE